MKAIAIVLAIISAGAILEGRADSLTESVQQKLKDQGFFYGEVTGQEDADTKAAIRRYQIRNGLEITGAINAQTQKSLGIKGKAPAAGPTTPPERPVPPRDGPDLRDDEPREQTLRPPTPPSRPPGYAPGSPAVIPDSKGLFDGTPYEGAPSDVLVRVIVGAQSLLARYGYYRGGIDGVYGPETEFALQAYQTRFGIEPSGRFDRETLAILGLLPGQRGPGITAPRRSITRRPWIFAPNGERIYIPR